MRQPTLPARVLLRLVRAYQGYSALRPPRCRFTPSCSAYAAEAVQVHGVGRGSWLVLRRLLRCQPLSAGGWDPVPEAATSPDRVPSSSSTVGAVPRHIVSGVPPCSR